MQNYLDLKMHVQHSACRTEAAYQIICHLGYICHCQYINGVRAFNHFRYLSATSKSVSGKVLEVPAILFGTLHGDVLPMSCANIADFGGDKKYLRMHFSTSTLKGQRSFRGHDTFMAHILMVGLLMLF